MFSFCVWRASTYVLVRVVRGQNKLKSNKTFPHHSRCIYVNVRYQNEGILIKSDTYTHACAHMCGMRRRLQKRKQKSIECHATPCHCLFVCFSLATFRNFSSIWILLVPHSNFTALKHNNTQKLRMWTQILKHAKAYALTFGYACTHQRKILNWNYHIKTLRGWLRSIRLQWTQTKNRKNRTFPTL